MTIIENQKMSFFELSFFKLCTQLDAELNCIEPEWNNPMEPIENNEYEMKLLMQNIEEIYSEMKE